MSALNTIKSSNITDHIQLGLKLYRIAGRLQNGSSKDIIITSSFKAEVNLLIDYYYNLTSNNDFKEILDNIKEDLDTFEGKTRSQVLLEI